MLEKIPQPYGCLPFNITLTVATHTVLSSYSKLMGTLVGSCLIQLGISLQLPYTVPLCQYKRDTFLE